MTATHYPDVLLHIGGVWRAASGGRTIDVINPSTEERIGCVAHASRDDLDEALAATVKGFAVWRAVSAYDRAKIMRKAGDILRTRAEAIARLMTLEQGKPLPEARMETLAAADIADWFAEEGRRAYGRVVPARAPGVTQLVVKEPVGPVAAFTPWNFPINQVVRKLSERARGWLLDHRQGARGDAGLSGRTDPLLRRCRRSRRCHRPRLRRAGRDQRRPHPSPCDPQGGRSPGRRRSANTWRRWPAST